MDIKSLKSIFSSRIKELRRTLNYSTKKMGDCLGASQTSYRRYEEGRILPDYHGLYTIAEKLGISLDWLVCGKGPVYYKEMEAKDLAEIKKGALQELLPDSTLDEVKDLLGQMNRIPLLRHEILVYFYKFKAEHKDIMVEGKEEQGYLLSKETK